jgi:hypothetical protein
MVKLKSAYRPKKPDTEIPEPAAPAISEPEPELAPKLEPAADSPALEEQQRERTEQADEAAERLRDQLKALAQSENIVRYHRPTYAELAQRPFIRDQLLEQWRHQGLSDANVRFLQANPELIDNFELTHYSANRATQEGHQPDTDAHREATRRIFNDYVAETVRKEAEPPPKFFQAEPPAIPAPRQPPSKSSHYSAPVSRETPSSRIYEADNDPRSVRLSADQVEAARIAGVTPAEYARQLIRMKRMQASGETQP